MKKDNIYDEFQKNVINVDIICGIFSCGEECIGRGIGTVVGRIVGFIEGLL